MHIATAEAIVPLLARLAASTHRPEVSAAVGGFAALARLPSRYRQPVLALSADGVGTKLRLAARLGRHEGVGVDLVAMNVNDLLTVGAEPFCFLDYFATGRLRPAVLAAVVRGIVRGCRAAGCSLVGGETAEMPSFYRRGEYDLAGFALGVVERDRVIDGRRIARGDSVVGLAASGLHSNGFSLVRRILTRRRLSLRARVPPLRRPLGETLLTPTRIYARALRTLQRAVTVHGIAHITGGGIPGNLARILPVGHRAVLERSSWPVPPIFSLLREWGNVPQAEMDRTFNNGIGVIVIVPTRQLTRALDALKRVDEKSYVLGRIERGSRGVILR